MKQQSEICKARSLFITKGMLNREILPSEIVYSWVRSKLHNISFEILDKNPEEKKVNILALKKNCSLIIKKLRQYKNDYHQLYLIDMDGFILYKSESQLVNIPNISNFKEEFVGTTAAGISLLTLEDSKVFGCEHFNQALTNYITGSLLIDGEIEDQQVIIMALSPLSRHFEHNQLLKNLNDQFKKEEEVDISDVSYEENDDVLSEKTPVNTLKAPSNANNEKIAGCSDKKECKQFTLSIIEKNTIIECLNYYNWNMRQAAVALGIGRSTLYRKLKEYEIQR